MRIFSALILTAAPLFGASIDFGSDMLNESNSRGANILAILDPSWQPNGPDYSWVTCAGCSLTPALPLDGVPTATFREFIDLPRDGVWSGSLNIWADDTVTAYLDGALIIAGNPLQLPHCSAGPGCMPGTDTITSISVSGIGIHALQMDVFQRVTDTPFGVMYRGSLSQPEVPEPGTIGMMALAGLMFLVSRFCFPRSQNSRL